MEFDFETLAKELRYKLLISTVVPRPIAWVTTLGTDGTVNAAPYSWFNCMGADPPMLVFAVNQHAEKRFKDTGRNILAAAEFVVNMVGEPQAVAMAKTSVDAPVGTDELKLAGLSTAPSVKVKPPRIAGAPVAYECVMHSSVAFGPNQAVVFGRIVQTYIADEMVLDKDRCHVDTPRMKLVGRMHGGGWYTRTTDLFELDRPKWEDWVRSGKV
jgi:flavin reductase (DIM6/NTAB) family NADH-FMN oxidoreductase RutF